MTRLQAARIRDAVRSELRFVDATADIAHCLHDSLDAVDVVVLPATVDDTSVERVIREIATHWRRVAIIVYCDTIARQATDLRALTLAGAHQFVFLGVNDDRLALQSILAAARQGCTAECVMSELAPIVPSRLLWMAEAVVAHPERVTSLPSLAAELGVHRKTLFNWCERSEFLPPGELLAWCRLALVAHHLANTGCTVETIAMELHYASATTLRNTIKRYTGFRASEIRERGGAGVIATMLQQRLDRHRSGLHQM